jgi:hypothetical protein
MLIDAKLMDRADVELRLKAAVKTFNEEERRLLELDPSERALTHRFAIHLERQFKGWDVDCEYNRDGFDVKRLELPVQSDLESDEVEARTVFPDIVVHRRGFPLNLLILEAKKARTRNRGLDDRQKVRAFIDQMGYQFGVTLIFRTGPTNAVLEPPDFLENLS